MARIVHQESDLLDMRADLTREGGEVIQREQTVVTLSLIHIFWNFLFFTGYLKKISERKDESGETLYLTMAIPNTEIKTIYKNSIAYWFEQRMKETDRSPLKHALETGDCEAAEDFINRQLADTISYYDYAENFYHGFMAGLLVNIGGYRVKSNRESGNGRQMCIRDSRWKEKSSRTRD